MGSAIAQPVVQAWVRYLMALHAHPLRTKALTAAALNGLEETAAQVLKMCVCVCVSLSHSLSLSLSHLRFLSVSTFFCYEIWKV